MLVATAADNIYIFFYFSEKIRLDISCESSAYLADNLHNAMSFSLKKCLKNRMPSATVLFRALRAKIQ